MGTAAEKRDRRTEILDAAEELFARAGFVGARLDDIARGLGVSRQALLHYFPSKDALYEAVLQRLFEQQQIVLAEAFEAPCDTMFERLDNLNGAWIRWLCAHPNYARIQLHNLASDIDHETPYWKSSHVLRQFYASTLKQGAAKSEFGACDINEFFALTGAYAAGFLQLSAGGRKSTPAARARKLEATLSVLTRALLSPR